MAAIQNDRDVLLQAAAVRVTPVPIPMNQVDGLTDVITDINNNVASALNNTKDLYITSSATVFVGSSTSTSPASITLTANFKNNLTGTVTWSVVVGTATLVPNGNTCTVAGTTLTGQSVTIRARVTVNSLNYDAFVVLSRLGALAGQDTVNLASQVTGQLAAGNITGLGALALLNTVNLNTQTTGALNGATQVTNLGSLAYANAIAANQIGAGTLAAGVIYSGTINAENINGGAFTGKTFTGGRFVGTSFATAASGARAEIFTTGQDAHTVSVTAANGADYTYVRAGRIITGSASNVGPSAEINSSTNSAMWLGCSPDAPHIVLKPIPTKPSRAWEGGIAFSSLHGFIFSEGVNWYKPAGWTVV